MVETAVAERDEFWQEKLDEADTKMVSAIGTV